ncbi:MAG TPA: hypothetical protein VK956_17975, partial [Verrucomicrobium sp.]|nr:hypothetical protein [Verrucomicrobium sp.]
NRGVQRVAFGEKRLKVVRPCSRSGFRKEFNFFWSSLWSGAQADDAFGRRLGPKGWLPAMKVVAFPGN